MFGFIYVDCRVRTVFNLFDVACRGMPVCLVWRCIEFFVCDYCVVGTVLCGDMM